MALWEEKFFLKVSQCRKTERGDPLRFFNIHSVAKHEKIEEKIFGKKSHNAEKNWKGGSKNAGGPFGEKNSKKMSRSAEKNWKEGPLVLPGMVCYAEKQGKPFWSSSPGQMVQFDTIIFGRTFNYFGQFVWIEKKSPYNSRVSLHEAPTKNERGHPLQ